MSLDATVSDPDSEDTLEYTWSHDSTALAITLANSAALDTSFAAPNVAEDTPVEFTLEVSDGTATVTDKVTVTITDSENTAPTVDAGGDQTVPEGSTVSLDATVSDPDSEDTLEYTWSHDSTALAITLANSAALDTSFAAPNVAEDTPVEFTLEVSDGTATVTDKVTVTITDSENTAPTVDAGGDQTVPEGSTVSLDATVSDPDSEDTLEYTWSHNSTALAITLANSAALDTSFAAPNVAEDTPVEFTLEVSDGTATVTDKVTVTITDSENTAPTVDAGGDQTVPEGSTVSLDATVSDPDSEDTLEYTWSHDSTLSITFADDAEDPSFTAPNVAEDTPVEFTLEVSDGTATVTDKVTVTITDSENNAPTVDAGGDQTVPEGSTVNLDGTATDLDSEDTLEYTWSHDSTLSITFADDAEDPSFTAPNVAEDTPVEFTLEVSDGTATVTDKVTVTITDSANTAPEVNAGPDQTVPEGSTVNLDGTATDLDSEDTLTYSWSHNSTALAITLANSAALDTSFAAPNVAGDTPVEFTLEVSDGTATVTDKVTVTITDSENTAPTVDAGGDQTVPEGSTVSLDATVSDPDSEDTLEYTWSHDSTALAITLANSAALDTSFAAPNVAGDTPVEFTLEVSDGTATVTDKVTVTITDSENTAPTVDAGGDQTVPEGSTVSLDATVSDPDSEDTLEYSWSHNSTALAITLANSAALDTSFAAPNVAEDTPVEFTLEVSDGTATVTDTVTVTITDSENTAPTVDAGGDQTV